MASRLNAVIYAAVMMPDVGGISSEHLKRHV